MNQGFLPVCRKDMEERGWDAVDFAYVIGDAYVDHPSFGPAIISRIALNTKPTAIKATTKKPISFENSRLNPK